MAEESLGRLIAIPALVTLAVTLLRLFGELQHWSPILFRRDPGGLGAVVGIIWLAPIFGVYFALKLVNVGSGPVTVGRAVAHAALGLGLFLVSSLVTLRLWPPFQVQVVTAAVVAIGVVLLQLHGWASLCKVLLLYAVAARVPVVMVMLFAIFGDWGTHYDAFPAGFPLTSPLEKWFGEAFSCNSPSTSGTQCFWERSAGASQLRGYFASEGVRVSPNKALKLTRPGFAWSLAA